MGVKWKADEAEWDDYIPLKKLRERVGTVKRNVGKVVRKTGKVLPKRPRKSRRIIGRSRFGKKRIAKVKFKKGKQSIFFSKEKV